MTVKEPTNHKYFSVVVKVDVDQLADAYTGSDPELASEDVDTMLEHELGWATASGISVSSIEEVEE